MDFLFELLFEVVLEGVFHLTIGNPKVKNWIKTLMKDWMRVLSRLENVSNPCIKVWENLRVWKAVS